MLNKPPETDMFYLEILETENAGYFTDGGNGFYYPNGGLEWSLINSLQEGRAYHINMRLI